MMSTATAVKVAENNLVIGGKKIFGYTPMVPQQKKLEKLLKKGNCTPSDIRNALRINMVIVIKDNYIEFWRIDGTNMIRSDAAMPKLDEIMAMDISSDEKARYIQGTTGHLAPVYIDPLEYTILFSRF